MNDEETVQRIGDYEVLGVLGAGGMGKVFKVRNVISDRIEAMKILLADLAGQKELGERFLREIKLLAGLNHPNIASLRTALTVGNQLVMIMEFVEGTTLAARVEQGRIPLTEAVDYIDQVLAALSYAHRQHIIHRDIKPANMMLTSEGLLKLMDFGIARADSDRGMTMTGATLGSPGYMSPEQIRGESVDARSDLYSVSVSLYEMVTGRRPFQSGSNFSIMTAHLQEAPTPPIELQPDLPSALSQVILMGLSKDPAQRFQSADAFRNALKSISEAAQKLPVEAAPRVEPPPAFAAAAVAVPGTSHPPARVPAGTLAHASVPAAQVGATVASPVRPIEGTVPARPQQRDVSSGVQPPPPVAKPAGYRGLYMTLGALVVAGILVLAAIYGPRWAPHRSSASASSSPAQTSTQSSIQPLATVPAASADSGKGANQSLPPSLDSPATSNFPNSSPPASLDRTANAAATATPGSAPYALRGGSGQPGGKGSPANGGKQHVINSASDAASSNAPNPSQPQGSENSAQQTGPAASTAPADSAALDDLEHQMDQLSSRAGAVKSSIDKLRNEQNAQGYNLRGDIAAAADRVETYMSKAQQALQSQDARNTKRYMDLAEPEVDKLEKFLGR
ncbi:MAG TPA: protein kinase [Terriglobia bacterium]|nr:protein kinase [Terriglobia bacterium]